MNIYHGTNWIPSDLDNWYARRVEWRHGSQGTGYYFRWLIGKSPAGLEWRWIGKEKWRVENLMGQKVTGGVKWILDKKQSLKLYFNDSH